MSRFFYTTRLFVCLLVLAGCQQADQRAIPWTNPSGSNRPNGNFNELYDEKALLTATTPDPDWAKAMDFDVSGAPPWQDHASVGQFKMKRVNETTCEFATEENTKIVPQMWQRIPLRFRGKANPKENVTLKFVDDLKLFFKTFTPSLMTFIGAFHRDDYDFSAVWRVTPYIDKENKCSARTEICQIEVPDGKNQECKATWRTLDKLVAIVSSWKLYAMVDLTADFMRSDGSIEANVKIKPSKPWPDWAKLQ